MNLTQRETACVLFALRNLQMELKEVPDGARKYYHADGRPITPHEIDNLCTKIDYQE